MRGSDRDQQQHNEIKNPSIFGQNENQKNENAQRQRADLINRGRRSASRIAYSRPATWKPVSVFALFVARIVISNRYDWSARNTHMSIEYLYRYRRTCSRCLATHTIASFLFICVRAFFFFVLLLFWFYFHLFVRRFHRFQHKCAFDTYTHRWQSAPGWICAYGIWYSRMCYLYVSHRRPPCVPSTRTRFRFHRVHRTRCRLQRSFFYYLLFSMLMLAGVWLQIKFILSPHDRSLSISSNLHPSLHASHSFSAIFYEIRENVAWT